MLSMTVCSCFCILGLQIHDSVIQNLLYRSIRLNMYQNVRYRHCDGYFEPGHTSTVASVPDTYWIESKLDLVEVQHYIRQGLDEKNSHSGSLSQSSSPSRNSGTSYKDTKKQSDWTCFVTAPFHTIWLHHGKIELPLLLIVSNSIGD